MTVEYLSEDGETRKNAVQWPGRELGTTEADEVFGVLVLVRGCILKVSGRKSAVSKAVEWVVLPAVSIGPW